MTKHRLRRTAPLTLGPTTRHAASVAYTARGWHALPLPRHSKDPSGLGSGLYRRTYPADQFRGEGNIGLVVGKASGNLVDVDLDCPEAIAAAAHFLPATHLIHGRASMPRAHYWYQVPTHLPPTRTAYVDVRPAQGAKTCLIELRSSDGSKGFQTVVPPSIHESGEPIRWDEYGEPGVVDGQDLAFWVKITAVTALLARHWPRMAGTRHEVALAVSGFLLRRGLDAHLVEQIIRVAAAVAGDDQIGDRRNAANTTAVKLALGESTTGGGKLAELLGDAVVKQLSTWFGVSARQMRADTSLAATISSITREASASRRRGEGSGAEPLRMTNFAEDHAVRHALLNAQRAHIWRAKHGTLCFTYKKLTVYFAHDDQTAMSLEEALERLRATSPAAVLTQRIILCLWDLQRRAGRLCANGDAAIRASDILLWRGLKKRSRLVDGVRTSDGWDPAVLDSVWNDLRTIASLRIRGDHATYRQKKVRWSVVDSPYVRIARREEVDGGTRVLADVFVSPGVWFEDYERAGNEFLAPVEQALFRLNPQNERHEVRLGLYLVERWRKLANEGNYTQPIMMRDLLEESVIESDAKNLTNRFIPRIDGALARLQEQGILGLYGNLTPVDREQRHWGARWLASEWFFLPPQATVEALEARVRGSAPDAPADEMADIDVTPDDLTPEAA